MKEEKHHRNFYFTFGQDHTTLSGKKMRNCWVRVVAEDHSIARMIFIVCFMLPQMEHYLRFATQYTDETFNPEYFFEGEYACIRQRAIEEEF